MEAAGVEPASARASRPAPFYSFPGRLGLARATVSVYPECRSSFRAVVAYVWLDESQFAVAGCLGGDRLGLGHDVELGEIILVRTCFSCTGS